MHEFIQDCLSFASYLHLHTWLQNKGILAVYVYVYYISESYVDLAAQKNLGTNIYCLLDTGVRRIPTLWACKGIFATRFRGNCTLYYVLLSLTPCIHVLNIIAV